MRGDDRLIEFEIDRHDADRLHRRVVAAGRAEAPVLLHLQLRRTVELAVAAAAMDRHLQRTAIDIDQHLQQHRAGDACAQRITPRAASKEIEGLPCNCQPLASASLTL